MHKDTLRVSYFAKNLGIIIGIVLVWRGVWYTLDEIDAFFFGGSHIYTALAGIIIGVLVLYLPDRNLREIEKL
jgi:hypothetical protein